MKNVLILHSYHQGFRWTDEIHRGFLSVLNKSQTDTKIYIEYLDSKRFFKGLDSALFQKLKDTYIEKYRDMDIDLILSSDDNAFRFLLKNRADIFGKAPVVFCGVNHFSHSLIKDKPFFTGVVERIDIEDSVALILKLFHNLEQIHVITDLTGTGIQNRELLKELAEVYRDKIIFKFIDRTGSGMTFDQLLGKVAEIPKGEAIYLADFFRDTNGFIDPVEMVSKVSKASKVPIFGHNGMDLGNGILGGKLNDPFIHGKEAAALALQVLSGKKVTDIPVHLESLNRFMFDYHQLERFGIDEVRLPSNSIIINRRVPFYLKYFFHISMSAIILFSLLLWNLSLRLRIRQKTGKLIESETKFRLLAENTTGTVYLCRNDANYTISYINKNIENLTGHNAEEFINHRVRLTDFIHPDDNLYVRNRIDRAVENQEPFVINYRILHPSRGWIWVEEYGSGVFKKESLDHLQGTIFDISDRKKSEEKQKKLITELQEALEKVKLLSGFIPICSSCKKIRDDKGYWNQLESYLNTHSEAEFSHSLCPDCAAKVLKDINRKKNGADIS